MTRRRNRPPATERKLIRDIRKVVAPYGVTVTGMGPHAVGVQGDARTYGQAVLLRFPSNATAQEISEVSTQVTNRVRGITRVLMDI